jgi:ABC-2 type transport system permease protein
MRLFWELIRLSFQRQLTYRAAAMAGLLTNLFFGFLRAAVLIALYQQQPVVAGMSIEDAITYTALAQGTIAYLSIFGWSEVMRSVYTGEVATDLLKPMSYFNFWLAQDIGRAMSNLLLRGVTIVLIYALIFEITVPTGLSQWLALAVSLLLGLLVSFAFRFWINLAAFWTPNATGISRFAFGLISIMSGFVMPLRFFPDWFVTICELTPFPSMVNTPVEVYLGLLHGPALLQALLLQLLWFMILLAVGQVTLRRGVHHLVIQGG